MKVFEEKIREILIREARGETTDTDTSGRAPKDGVDTNIRCAKGSSNTRCSGGKGGENWGGVRDGGPKVKTKGVSDPNGPRKVEKACDLSEKGLKDTRERRGGEEGRRAAPARSAKGKHTIRGGEWGTPRAKGALAEATQDRVKNLVDGTREFGINLLQDLHRDGARRPGGRDRSRERPMSGPGRARRGRGRWGIRGG